MLWKKIKKNTYNFFKLKKKIDTSSINTGGKKSFSVDKKKSHKPSKPFNKFNPNKNIELNQINKKIFTRKIIEQQATKDFIKKENKPGGKVSLNLKAR